MEMSEARLENADKVIADLRELEAYFNGEDTPHIPQNAMRIRSKAAADLIATLRAQVQSGRDEVLEEAAKVADKWAAMMRRCADDTAKRPARDRRDHDDLARMETQFRRRAELAASVAGEIRALTPQPAPTEGGKG